LDLAKQGDAKAQGFVGHLYDAGKGVQKDPAEANRWFKLAADQGEVGAQANLCGSYAYGDGIEQDAVQAFHWCQLSASRGNEFAEYLIGQLYMYGDGVEQDVVEAYKWFLLCRAQARHQSLRDLVAEEMAKAEDYLTPEQIDKAKRLAADWKPVAP
jgi:TPR repeat protein